MGIRFDDFCLSRRSVLPDEAIAHSLELVVILRVGRTQRGSVDLYVPVQMKGLSWTERH